MATPAVAKSVGATLQSVIIQITIINLVFSVDSILTAIGMTNGVEGALLIMIIAVVVSVGIMMAFAVPVGNFVTVTNHPNAGPRLSHPHRLHADRRGRSLVTLRTVWVEGWYRSKRLPLLRHRLLAAR